MMARTDLQMNRLVLLMTLNDAKFLLYYLRGEYEDKPLDPVKFSVLHELRKLLEEELIDA